ncbi:MAG: hypothetical protein HQ488_03185 [Parcubacteria group bacterium]|nr:hypothetical protein [Parcubacteria group bacterium]
MSEYEQITCSRCGTNRQGRRIIQLDKDKVQRWNVLDRQREKIRRAGVDAFMLSGCLGSCIFVGAPVLVESLFGEIPGWISAALFVSTVVLLCIPAWMFFMRWLIPRTVGEKSREVPLRQEQDQIVTDAGYDLNELRRHGYLVKE